MKACPFCGNKDLQIKETVKSVVYYSVICSTQKDGCGAESGWMESPEDAIEAWDMRVMTVVET